MQQEILSKHPTTQLRVYVVWFPVLGGDSRAAWDPTVIPDSRVRQYYDTQRLIGRWFAQSGQPSDDFVWDTYLLYGPDAKWESEPAPLISSGGTIIAQSADLQAAVLPLLK